MAEKFILQKIIFVTIDDLLLVFFLYILVTGVIYFATLVLIIFVA